ncbi:glycoside hydrolase family 18 protein, partial [Aulographum hederae CBS 113979]
MSSWHLLTLSGDSPSSAPAPFNPSATDNGAVYFGSQPSENATLDSLHQLCLDPAINIVNLAFLTTFFGAKDYPSIDFGPGCAVQTSRQALHAPGLFDCSELAEEVQSCQTAGKKVFVSLQASTLTMDTQSNLSYVSNANSTFTTADSAVQFAATLWSLFGAGTDENLDLRPFGEIIIDGFDLYPISPNASVAAAFTIIPPHDFDFVLALREKFLEDPSGRDYYISAAPTSNRPDTTIGLAALREMDFIYIRYFDS